MRSVFVAIAIAIVPVLGSLLSYGIATTFIVQFVAGLIRSGYAGLSFWKNLTIVTVVMLATAAAHLVQIALWAVVLLLVGGVATFDRAFYVSAQNYTALGYGDTLLSEQWRLLGPLEATNGLTSFGLSTAVMFAVMNRLITDRLRLQQRPDHLEQLPDSRRQPPPGRQQLIPRSLGRVLDFTRLSNRSSIRRSM